MDSTSTAEPRLLGIAQVTRRLGVEKTSIWRWTKAGKFPQPIYVSEHRKWWLHDIEAWERIDPAESRPADASHGICPDCLERETRVAVAESAWP